MILVDDVRKTNQVNSNCVWADNAPFSSLFLQGHGMTGVASNVFSKINTEFK